MSARGFDPKAIAGKVPPPERRVELLVVGAGPAGVAAAIEAAEAGVQVLLVDESPVDAGLMGNDVPLYFGGRYTGAVQNKGRMLEQVVAASPGLEAAMEAGVEVELGVYVWGAFVGGEGLASLPEPLAGLADEERSWMVGFRRLIVATGARDVAFAFPGWNQPGVMGARGLSALTRTYDAFSGRRLAILGSGALAMDVARQALAKGLEVVAVIEARPKPQSDWAELGALVLAGHAPVAASTGLEGVTGLTVRDLPSGVEREIACDTIVEAIGVTPTVELLDVLGAKLAMAPRLGGHAPVSPDGVSTSLPQVFIAGDVAGVPGGVGLTVEKAAESGRRAARAAMASSPAHPEAQAGNTGCLDALEYQQDWMRALMEMGGPSVVVCQCEEVTREALLAVRQPAYLGPPSPGMQRRELSGLLRDGPANLDQIKRLTRAGMGPCQGRRCREQIALTVACASGVSAKDIPLAGYRAPVRPLPLAVLAEADEHRDMARFWDVWFGIRGQWTPYEDIGTDREDLNADLLGGDAHA